MLASLLARSRGVGHQRPGRHAAPPQCASIPGVAGDGAISEEDMEIVLRQLAGSSLSDDELKSIIAKVRRSAQPACWHSGRPSRMACRAVHPCGTLPPAGLLVPAHQPTARPLTDAAGDAHRGGGRAGADLPGLQGSA